MNSIINVGKIDYDSALTLQLEERQKIKEGLSDGKIFILEHDPPVITLGRFAKDNNILLPVHKLTSMGYEIKNSSRGGDVTLHEAGQIVVYFVLPVQSKNPKLFVSTIVNSLIFYINTNFELEATYDTRFPGIWHNNKKLCSIGFDFTEKISMHGIALNVNNTLQGFDYINPCGQKTNIMTTLAIESQKEISTDTIISDFNDIFSKINL